VKDYRTS
jgi:hypothetical protein